MEVQKLQRYDLVERIAAGGMGEVFRARALGPLGFEKTLAVKRILPEYAADPDFVERFVRECKLAVSLSHGNLVQVFDLGRAGQELFLVMEYVHGADLARLLAAARAAGRRFPLALALYVVSEAAQGLAYAHSRFDLAGKPQVGVVHCDISPSNILLSYSGEVKLTDFGVAELVDRTRRQSAEGAPLMGKRRYMAPEQLRGEPVDARTDLYALGVVLYEMLVGRRAFAGDGAKSTSELALAEGAPQIRDVYPDAPEAIERWLERLMAPDPRARPADARAFLRDLAALQDLLQERGSALDLATLVRELVPPQAASAARPAESYTLHAEGDGSQALTQWLPVQSTSAAQAKRERTRLRTFSALMSLGVVVLSATLLRQRITAGMEAIGRHGDHQDSGEPPAAPGGEPSPAAAPPQQPVEAMPETLAKLLDARAAPRPAAPDPGAERRSVARPKGPGYLDIYAEPWAQVSLDGRVLEKPTPLVKYEVKAGSHELVLTNPVLKKRQVVQVMVSEGQRQKVEVYLVK